MRVISIYQEQLAKSSQSLIRNIYPGNPPPLPPRKSPVTPLLKSMTLNDDKVSSWVSNVFSEGSSVESDSKDQDGKTKSEDSLSGEGEEKRPTVSQRNFSFVAYAGSSDNIEAISVDDQHLQELAHQKSIASMEILNGTPTPKQERKVSCSTKSAEAGDQFYSLEDLTTIAKYNFHTDPSSSSSPPAEKNQPQAIEKGL